MIGHNMRTTIQIYAMTPITESKGNSPLASYDEPITRTDNRINEPPLSYQVKGKSPLARCHKSLTWTDNRITNLQPT